MKGSSRNDHIINKTKPAASEPGERRTACADSCRGRLRPRFRSTEGAELFEFAMALPLLLVLVVGIIDFAHAYNTKHITSNAAREAARLLSSTPLSDSSCPTCMDHQLSGQRNAVRSHGDGEDRVQLPDSNRIESGSMP